jgi:hypothetical protein
MVSFSIFQFAIEHRFGDSSRLIILLLWTRRLSGTRAFAATNNARSASASATLPSAEWATALA